MFRGYSSHQDDVDISKGLFFRSRKNFIQIFSGRTSNGVDIFSKIVYLYNS